MVSEITTFAWGKGEVRTDLLNLTNLLDAPNRTQVALFASVALDHAVEPLAQIPRMDKLIVFRVMHDPEDENNVWPHLGPHNAVTATER